MSGGSTISTSETRLEALAIQSSAYGVTVPVVYGSNRISGNMIWYGDFKANPHTSSTTSGGKGGGVTQENTTYSYSASVIMALCEGTVAGVPQIWKDKALIADGSTTALSQLSMSLATGALAQSTWAYLNTFTPAGGAMGAQALGYSGLSYVYAQDYSLGSAASVVNHSFEVRGQFYGGVAGSSDANTALAAADMLTNVRYGAGFPEAQLDTTAWSNYVLAAGLLTSPALTEQVQAGEFITRACALTNTAAVWSGGKMKLIPYGDTAMTGNGATYTPNVTPLFDLGDDDFCPSLGDDPIRVTRKSQADVFNHIRIEFVNRANFYNVEIAEAKDSASIDAYGLRSADVLTAHWICDVTVARAMAQLILQRSIYIRNTYEFELPWTRAMLEPMDLVTLTDSVLGFANLAVRVTEVGESEAGDLSIVAEDFPVGVAHAALYTSQAGVGFQHNYNAAPGSVITPMFFEAPIERTTTGLEVYAAVRGLGVNWGGCRVWTSLDGIQYKDSGMIYGGARYGKLTGPVAAGSLPVLLNGGQMLSGSAVDSANLSTLCYIGGANPEYLAHGTATLTGALAYTLSGLTRSAFGTSGAAHSTNDPFVRVDDALAKSGPLDLSMVGQTIYFKFTSFNIYKVAEESLATVPAYPYAVVGSMANLPPPPFDNFLVLAQPDGTRQYNFSYAIGAPVDWLGAEIRYVSGTTSTPDWASMTPLQDTATYYTHSPVELNAPLSGVYTFACKSLDHLGNESSYLVRNITLPNRRLGNVFDEFFEGPDGWLGTRTGCQMQDGYLQAIDSTTWATLPSTWSAWTRWNVTPATPITYTSPVRDFGTVVAGQVNSVVDADGTVLQEIATSANGTTWSAWGSAVAAFSSRYIKIRLTVTATGPAPVPVIRDWSYQIISPMKSEYLNDIVLSSLTGSYRIGVGDIRIPLAGSYTVLKRTSIVIQDSSAGTWTYARIDQSLSPAPRWQFRLNGTLADPAFVDFFIEGY